MSVKRVFATIPVSDMAAAAEFYERKLGLSRGEDRPDGGRDYDAGSGTAVHIYPSPENAGKSPATVAAFETDDVEATIDELKGKGVTFEQYGEPFNTNEKGIVERGGQKGAWCKDPDGNIISIFQFPPS
jgi:catechol 2,3-dioxygenase-like lactoylglutathione lyase family enzyme